MHCYQAVWEKGLLGRVPPSSLARLARCLVTAGYRTALLPAPPAGFRRERAFDAPSIYSDTTKESTEPKYNKDEAVSPHGENPSSLLDQQYPISIYPRQTPDYPLLPGQLAGIVAARRTNLFTPR